jgi:hypothetical protein
MPLLSKNEIQFLVNETHLTTDEVTKKIADDIDDLMMFCIDIIADECELADMRDERYDPKREDEAERIHNILWAEQTRRAPES